MSMHDSRLRWPKPPLTANLTLIILSKLLGVMASKSVYKRGEKLAEPIARSKTEYCLSCGRIVTTWLQVYRRGNLYKCSKCGASQNMGRAISYVRDENTAPTPKSTYKHPSRIKRR